MYRIMVILLFLIISLYSKDVTDNLLYVGSPYNKLFASKEDTYSRNVWDLQVYDDLIFIGAGNSANEGPSINSGPIPLMRYNPKTKKFKKETIIYDDQVDIFKVIDHTLYIPGHDATGSWRWGNIYKRLPDKTWKMYRTVPNALHIYDLVMHKGKFFAGIGLDEGAAVGVSKDLQHWNIIKLGRSRVYNFLKLAKEFYAVKKFKRTSRPYFSIAEYKDKYSQFSAHYDVGIKNIFPNTRFDIKYSRMVRTISFDKRAIYIGAYKYNSHQTKPFGLYWIRKNAHKIDIDGYIPRDILKRGDILYVLVSKQINSNDVNMKVLEFSKDNLEKYKELFSFHYPTFARSFEKLHDTFYFGMGSNVDEGNVYKLSDIKKETGDILSYKVDIK